MPTNLTEDSRLKLDGIVQEMIANQESEENIQFVVNDFKQKYSTPKTTPPDVSFQMDPSGEFPVFEGERPYPKEDPGEWYRKIRPYLKPTAEGIGLVGGGLAGTTAGPAGTVAGAGLGYAGAKEAINLLDQKYGYAEAQPLTQEFIQSGKDVLEGMVLEAGGAVFGKAIQLVGKKAIPIAKRIYESALKPSTTLNPSVIDRRITTALREGATVTKGGFEKNIREIKGINNTISGRIKQYATEGEAVLTQKAVRPLGELEAATRAKSITPSADIAVIAKLKEEVLAGQPAKIPINQAQIFKQTINKELDDFYKAISKGRVVPPKSLLKAKSALAKGLREEIAQVFPEVTKLNQREGALIELNKSLGRAVNRIRNRELIPLVVGITTGVAPAHYLWKALLLKTVEHPWVKSRLAIALYRAGQKPLAEMGKRAVQAGAIGVRSAQDQPAPQPPSSTGLRPPPVGLQGLRGTSTL